MNSDFFQPNMSLAAIATERDIFNQSAAVGNLTHAKSHEVEEEEILFLGEIDSDKNYC